MTGPLKGWLHIRLGKLDQSIWLGFGGFGCEA
jgi:hypothetical protein